MGTKQIHWPVTLKNVRCEWSHCHLGTEYSWIVAVGWPQVGSCCSLSSLVRAPKTCFWWQYQKQHSLAKQPNLPFFQIYPWIKIRVTQEIRVTLHFLILKANWKPNIEQKLHSGILFSTSFSKPKLAWNRPKMATRPQARLDQIKYANRRSLGLYNIAEMVRWSVSTFNLILK